MSWILAEGSCLQAEGLRQPLQILRPLGGGTQGQVYAVRLGDEELALKWYLPACIARDRQLEQRLLQAIRLGAPNGDFLWPLALVRPSREAEGLVRLREPGFGYLMPLRPAGFLGAHEHAAGQLQIGLTEVLRAAFFLADGFHQLHLKGLCYKDISLGNLFLNPSDGGISICDNDNVDVDGRDLGSVLGTPGFMAPEVLLGQAKPSTNSDLFSLAVLIFRLLTRHDPFKGQMELAIRCLDEPARRRLYAEEPVFIFDPTDPRNRPNSQEHSAALITWPIYPPALQALFVQTFGLGLRQPQRRVLTGQWTQALSRCLDGRRLCASCGQENFHGEHCWSCGQPLPAPAQLHTAKGVVLASAGNRLYRHHVDALAPEDLHQPLAAIVAHPEDPGVLGLRNLSGSPWRAALLDGRSLDVEPGKSCNVAALHSLHTPMGRVQLHR
jgi:DNA-binding helix-hairpin-helix protein with protein kinase domain